MKLELENINNLVVDDLDLRNRNWTAIDDSLELKADKTYVDTQLSEKVQNFKIKNEIVNGDFANGATGWTRALGTLAWADNYIEYTMNTSAWTSNVRTGQNIDWIAGHKYYIRARVYSEGVEGETYTFVGNRLESFSSGYFTIASLAPFNQWHESGVVYVPPHTVTDRLYIGRRRTDQGFDVGDSYRIDRVMLLKLTEIFGAGNEPTKIEMDELMKVIPNGWWDGELSLTQKQFITWQLNLIRKNTNAIIALGGTII